MQASPLDGGMVRKPSENNKIIPDLVLLVLEKGFESDGNYFDHILHWVARGVQVPDGPSVMVAFRTLKKGDFCTWEYERSPFVQKNLFLVEQTWNQKAPKKGGNMYWAVLVSRLTDEYTLLIYLDHMIWYTMTCLATLIWYTMIKYVRDGVDVVVLYQLLQYW